MERGADACGSEQYFMSECGTPTFICHLYPKLHVGFLSLGMAGFPLIDLPSCNGN